MRWTEVVVKETTIEQYCRVFDGLWTLQGVSAHDPRVVPFTTLGRQTFIACANALYTEVADPHFPDTLRGPFAKLEGYGARLALLV
jgi:integrase